MAQRAVLHLDLDAFFVSVERLRNRRLYNLPVIVGNGNGRGVVTSCSYEARKFGVKSGMSGRMARRLCPEAVFIRGNFDAYTYYSRLVTEILTEQVPVVEKASIDEFYLDLSGMDRFYGCYKFSGELGQRIRRETGLPLSFGLSVNKLVSKIGTGEVKPEGQVHVKYGREKNFIAPLSVARIPGVGSQTFQMLSALGIKHVQTLQEMPAPLLERRFGKPGRQLWEKAHGMDNRPVEPYSEEKSISTEHTFEMDTADQAFLNSILTMLTEKLTYELRSRQKRTSCVTVKLRYADFDTVSRQQRIAYTSLDNVILPVVKELFRNLFERRQMLRLVGVKFSGLVQGAHQIDLFSNSQAEIRLYQALDAIRDKYGHRSVMRGAGY